MDEGIGLIDFSDLPPRWRTVLQLVLREQALSYDALEATFGALPEDERITSDDLRAVVAELCDLQWLIRSRADDQVVYKVNLRRRTGRNQMAHIWDALGVEKKESDAESPVVPRRGANRPLPKSIWNNLSDAERTQTTRAVQVDEDTPGKPDETQTTPALRPRRGSALDNLSFDADAPKNPADETHPSDTPSDEAKPVPKPRHSFWDNLTSDDKTDDKPHR